MKQVVILTLLVAILASCSSSYKVEQISLIPKPEKLTLHEKSFRIEKGTKISIQNSEQKKAANFLSKILKTSAGFELPISESLEGDITFKEVEGLAPEAYQLEVNQKKITIRATGEAGYFYAVQTLRQLLPNTIEGGNSNSTKWIIPCVTIEDEPRFAWRGMHMDFSRHFFSIDEVKTFLDYMALYKLNTYHMHLTDDQGWRIEIKKYPLLTEKGAWRIKSKNDTQCIELAKTDSSFQIDTQHYHNINGQKMYGGFFTQEQIKEIVKYADEHCIKVIPEIDMPGHLKSAIDNYPYLSCTGEAGWGSSFSIPACLGQEVTYEFMQDILSEVAELFPAEYIHIGGDEVNIKSWTECDKCQNEIKHNHLKNEHELQAHFNQRIEKFIHSKGKKLMGWDEIAEGGLSKDASMMWWRNWAPKLRNIAASNGNNIVMTPDFEYYFDFMNKATPLKKVYNYEPVPADFTSEQEKFVMGVQANIWTEKIANFKRLQYQVFPRMLALAETGWTSKETKNYDNFSSRILSHYDRMDEMNIHYYIPPVSGLNDTINFVDSAIIELKTTIPKSEIYYTLDGSTPSKNTMLYKKPFSVNSELEIRVITYRGEIASKVSSCIVKNQTETNYTKRLN
ncbi:MAG: family 20 glycosylhydrolase [Draconibacterium sp.]|nr:family 20 glycosylhydrolase [Draconibacterium sp.]